MPSKPQLPVQAQQLAVLNSLMTNNHAKQLVVCTKMVDATFLVHLGMGKIRVKRRGVFSTAESVQNRSLVPPGVARLCVNKLDVFLIKDV